MKLRLIMVNTSFYSTYRNKLYGNIVYQMQIEMSDFIQVPASLVFAAISEFRFSGFSKFTIHKLATAVTAFLIASLIKSNNKKLDQIISKLLTLSKYSTCSVIRTLRYQRDSK